MASTHKSCRSHHIQNIILHQAAYTHKCSKWNIINKYTGHSMPYPQAPSNSKVRHPKQITQIRVYINTHAHKHTRINEPGSARCAPDLVQNVGTAGCCSWCQPREYSVDHTETSIDLMESSVDLILFSAATNSWKTDVTPYSNWNHVWTVSSNKKELQTEMFTDMISVPCHTPSWM